MQGFKNPRDVTELKQSMKLGTINKHVKTYHLITLAKYSKFKPSTLGCQSAG